jgi:predicted branched-subunit amino acid permease
MLTEGLMRENAKEALGITATLFALWIGGSALGGGIGQFMTGVGLLAMALTFAAVFAVIFAWTMWFYRRK